MAKISVSKSIVVNAPIETVFENFNDPIIQTEWFVEPNEVRNYTPPLAKGVVVTTVSKMMGREVEATMEVMEFEPPNLVVFKLSGIGSGDIRHTCEEVSDGVRVTIEADVEMLGWLGNLAAPLLRGQIEKQMKGDLASFKQFIEG